MLCCIQSLLCATILWDVKAEWVYGDREIALEIPRGQILRGYKKEIAYKSHRLFFLSAVVQQFLWYTWWNIFENSVERGNDIRDISIDEFTSSVSLSLQKFYENFTSAKTLKTISEKKKKYITIDGEKGLSLFLCTYKVHTPVGTREQEKIARESENRTSRKKKKTCA